MYSKDRQAQISEWFTSQTGQDLLHLEKQGFERLSAQIFGYHLLQIGWLEEDCPMLVDSKLQHQILIGKRVKPGMQNFIAANSAQLPVMTDSVDAVLLPHTLDFSTDPQNVLREVERILIPEGRLIISGFNPISLWGVQRAFKRKAAKEVPWLGHFVSYTRLHDWLSLLGFDVEQTEVAFFRPLLQKSPLMKKLEFMEKMGTRFWPGFGSVYMIKAVKRVSRLTPVKPIWKRRPRLLANVVETTSRGYNSRHDNKIN